MRTTLTMSASFLDWELVDQLLGEDDDGDDLFSTLTPLVVAASDEPSSVSEAVSPTTPSLRTSKEIQAKRIRPDLDVLPLAASSWEDRNEYFTVGDFVWPSPTKRVCYRMPEEQRRQRHRESQREFLVRKRIQLQEMRKELRLLERQVAFARVTRELRLLAVEQLSLQATLQSIEATLHAQVRPGGAQP